jgi:hypothetical protein
MDKPLSFRSVFLIAGALVLSFSINAFSQCRSVAKKQCFPQLAPYTQNGQFNSAKLGPGETAEIQMTFYAGQNYRLMVCAEGVLGDVTFKVSSADKQELYNSRKTDAKIWDFNVAATQQLIVLVEVPPSDSQTKIVPEGCVSIIVGFKKL